MRKPSVVGRNGQVNVRTITDSTIAASVYFDSRITSKLNLYHSVIGLLSLSVFRPLPIGCSAHVFTRAKLGSLPDSFLILILVSISFKPETNISISTESKFPWRHFSTGL